MRPNPLLIAVLLLAVYNYCYTQIKVSNFGDVSRDELLLKECSFEKDASAMFLVNEENIVLKQDYNYSKTFYERRARIKIFNERGFAYASIIIKNAKTRYSKIDDFEAAVYNISADGKIVTEKLDEDQVFKQKNGYKGKNTDLRFTFPGLKPGSVIEYKYTKIVKDALNFEPWLLQDQIPVLLSSCNISIPNTSDVTSRIIAPQQTGADSIITTDNKTKTGVSKKFVLQRIPSFRIEPLMSSITDNLERIEFSVHRSSFFSLNESTNFQWQLLSSYLKWSPFFSNQLQQQIEGTQPAIDSIKAMDSDEKKSAAVYDLITARIKWNEEQLFVPENIADAWKTKTGSSAEINLLIMYFLKKANVNCKLLLISTKEHGKTDMQFPTLSQFNGVDVLVYTKDETYVIDGTQKYQSYKIPPLNILNRNALLIDENGTWINISDGEPYMTSSTNIYADLDSNGVLHGNAQIALKNYAKVERLKEMQEDEDQQKEEAKDFIRYDDEDLIIDSTSTQDSADKTLPLIVHNGFHYTLANNDDFYFLNPFFFSMFRKNPFTDTERHSDIDFGCKQKFTTYILINVPENFSIEEPPKSKLLRTEDTSLYFRKDVSVSANQIGIRYDFQLNNPLFSKENYAGVKDFFDKVYVALSQQILLKKKND